MLCTCKERAFDSRALHCSTGSLSWQAKSAHVDIQYIYERVESRRWPTERQLDEYNGPSVRTSIRYIRRSKNNLIHPARLFRRAISGFHYRGIDG
jgi:hypothetical protein